MLPHPNYEIHEIKNVLFECPLVSNLFWTGPHCRPTGYQLLRGEKFGRQTEQFIAVCCVMLCNASILQSILVHCTHCACEVVWVRNTLLTVQGSGVRGRKEGDSLIEEAQWSWKHRDSCSERLKQAHGKSHILGTESRGEFVESLKTSLVGILKPKTSTYFMISENS